MSSSSSIIKSRSYPENLKDAHTREIELKIDICNDTIERFREKDHIRTERFAALGSPSSMEVVVISDWRASCCRTFSKIVNYILEREEETQHDDEEFRKKSYAGFYYFIKWFVRALFFLLFTTLGTIAGKEAGCAIKDNDACDSKVVDLVDGSPHIAATILGIIFGLIIGQWLGRVVWDYSTETIRKILRKLEKWADESKLFLILFSAFVYIIISGAFTVTFLFFVKIGDDDNNIIGGVVGGCIGLILAVFAYRKASNCQRGEPETPMILPIPPPSLNLPEITV